MEIDRRDLLTGLAATAAAASLPAVAFAAVAESVPVLPAPESEDLYDYYLKQGLLRTFDELYAALLPHKAELLAFENRANNPVRRLSRSRAGHSRVRARIAARSHAD
jgi:hypothetical protein